jgi:hypothetical protein
MKRQQIGIIVFVALLVWCADAFAYLVPAVTVSPALRTNHLPEVLIYYANATDPDDQEREDYRQIIEWLYDTEDPALIEIATQFESDLTHFPMMVDRDLRAMDDSLSNANGALAGIVVVTNPLARNQRARVWRYPQKTFETAPMPIAQEEGSLRSNPLAAVSGLNAVLSLAANLFDPATHHYILITKSHGTDEFALTPRLVTPSSLGRERVLAIARDQATLDHPRPGVTKTQFAAALERFGRSAHMIFSFIFLESCDSSSGLTTLPANVGTIVATDDSGAQSNTISYDRLFGEMYSPGLSQRDSPSDVLERYLARKMAVLNPHPTVSRLKASTIQAAVRLRLLFFLPLVLLLIGTAVRRVRGLKRYSSRVRPQRFPDRDRG